MNKPLISLTVFAVVASCCITIVGRGEESENFFGKSFIEALETTTMEETQFSKLLELTGERRILDLGKQGEWIIRLIWIRTLDKVSYVVRVTISSDAKEGGVVTKRIRDGGTKIEEDEIRLGEAECGNLIRFLGAFWYCNHVVDGDGGLDGSAWCMEGKRNEHYNIVARASPFLPFSGWLEGVEGVVQNRQVNVKEACLSLAFLNLIRTANIREEDIY